MNLYMISLGGKVKGCNVEVHDVQFVAANHIEETVDILKKNWYGQAEKLHMDSYKVIKGADGFTVRLTGKKPDDRKQLYFLHMGGYLQNSTQEQHDVGLLVGEAEKDVKERALMVLKAAEIENHVDSIINISNCILSANGSTYYIELTESQEEFDQSPDWFGYRRLDLE